MLLIIFITIIMLLTIFKFNAHSKPTYPHRYFKKANQPKASCKNNRKPDWVKNEIITLKAKMPTFGCRKIADEFNRSSVGENMRVSKSYVAEVIKQNLYLILSQNRKRKSRHAIIGKPNTIWGMDLTFKTVQDSEKMIPILGIIDHGTRKKIALKPIANKTSLTLIVHLCLAIAQYGKPKAIRTDNERCFNSLLFNNFLKLIKIKHQCIDKHSPWQNGRIERLFGTLKANLNQLTVSNTATLQTLLSQFGFWYDEIRPHQNLEGHTPHEVWYGINAFEKPCRSIQYFSAWGGLLTGFYIHR